MEDGAWMLWRNSSVVVVAAVVTVAHPGLEKLLEFHYGIGASGVRGSIRLVETSTAGAGIKKSCRRKQSNLDKPSKEQ